VQNNDLQYRNKITFYEIGDEHIVTYVYEELAWLIIMGSGSDDWVYGHFFKSTVNYKSSHTELLLNDVCLTNPHEESLTALNESESYIMTDGQSASLSWNKAPIWGLRQDLDYCQTVAALLWGVLSDERMGLSFATATGPRQRSHSRAESRRTRGHILLSQIRDFPFCRLLRLAESRWRYSTPSPHG
jgi:hypothetical protein